MLINPYLTFNGTCEAAFNRYAEIFKTPIKMMMRFREMPGDQQIPPGWEEKVMHAAIEMEGARLMGSDRADAHYQKPQGMVVSVVVDTPEEAERIFGALAEGGEITMPMAETFWAQRFGMLTDAYGVPFMINCEKRH
jgi:PhnB protein